MTGAELRRLPKYSIGIVSRMVGVHPQMLRRFEEAGLLEPAREGAEGKKKRPRLYSDEHIEILMEIIELSYEGVNIAGIRHILQLRQQIQMLQQEISEARALLQHHHLDDE
ncbi:MAG: MerR family transcriptional regulator [Ktedonobacteraceae bacterium]|nr:MerR family transcriptional regulator [Ktedonobacteraceae bacterium]